MTLLLLRGDDVALHLIRETDTTITLGWDDADEPPGCVGWRFTSDAMQPKWSHTWDPARRTIRFAKSGNYRVQPLVGGTVLERP